MKSTVKSAATALFLAIIYTATWADDEVPAHPYIEMVTTAGTIRLELDGREAPLTVAHFLELVDSGFYDGTIFHRVISDFMIQGGGHTPDLKLREDERTIPNESGNKYSNLRGTIAMARTNDPHSANSQFFINLVDNQRLDPNKSAQGGRWGYTVFGYVIEGMEVVEKIGATPVGPKGTFQNLPNVPIVIEKMSRFTYE